MKLILFQKGNETQCMYSTMYSLDAFTTQYHLATVCLWMVDELCKDNGNMYSLDLCIHHTVSFGKRYTFWQYTPLSFKTIMSLDHQSTGGGGGIYWQ